MILCVESDPDLRDLLAFTLRREGFHVQLHPSGTPLWPLVRAHAVALVVLDLGLSAETAAPALARLATLRVHSAVPVLLTGRVAEALVLRGFAPGADDYLAKPYSFPVLVAHARSLLRRWAAAVAPVPAPDPRPHEPGGVGFVLADGVPFDATHHVVTQGAAAVRLTPLESRLLHVLCLQPGQALATERLWERVRGFERASAPGVIRSHIRHLRAKLERRPSQPRLIHTIPGRGYVVAQAQCVRPLAD